MSGNPGTIHAPVLLKETMELLGVKEDGVYVDGTVGLGGHASQIVSLLGPRGICVGVDRDEEALSRARERIGNGRFLVRKGSFSELGQIVSSLNIEGVNGVLFDLGISMLQVKTPARGFSFDSPERLDMRMDASQELTAWDVVNRYPEREVERIIREYGEEPCARRIAKAIAFRRSTRSINSCIELALLITEVCRRRGRRHPATRTFQALRIEVNREMEELQKGLDAALTVLKAGGRLSVISYHSIEDRIVKNFMRDRSRAGLLRILTKKPVTPGPDELRQNPSSRSAKLRGAERL